MSDINLCLYVTSECNLSCPHCNQKPARASLPGYSMTTLELLHFCNVSQDKKIRYKSIELCGGEPTLWKHFEGAIDLIQSYMITDEVSFVTNGRDAQNVARLAKRYGLRYVVSATQATHEELGTHLDSGNNVAINAQAHKPPPQKPVPGSLPAVCSVRKNAWGEPINHLGYADGVVYYCGCAQSNMSIVGPDPLCMSPFEGDFVKQFSNKQFDRPICSVCLCNDLVWNKVPDAS